MENELRHHGIKGQRWGIRRFQKKDGTLTPAGKKRYADDLSDDAKDASNLRQKSPSQMSNAELKRLNARMQLEENYYRLNPSKAQKAAKTAAAVVATMGTVTALYNNGKKLVEVGKPVCSKIVNKVGNKVVDMAGNAIIKDMMKHM